LVAAGATAAAHAERPRVYALTGGTVVTAPGRTIDGGTVVLRDGLIAAVAAGGTVPNDAVGVDVRGLWVYPGFIDADTTLGLSSDDREPRRPDSGESDAGPEQKPGAHHPVSRVHPEDRARDRLLPFEGDRKREVERYRDLGFTVALAVPDRGIFRGESVAILLQDDVPVAELILRDRVAQHVAFEMGRFGEGYPTSLMGAAAVFRQTLLDAERYAEWSARYAAHPRGLKRPETVAAWAALSGVLDGSQAVVFALEDGEQYDLADRLAREFELNAVISASGAEWEIAERVASSQRTLIFPIAFPDKPKVQEDDEALDVSLREMLAYLEAPAAAARLDAAGVELAFTTRGLKNLADFSKNLESMVGAGLPEATALAALTTVPARILGIDASVGTLEPGKIANVVVMDGPLFGKGAKAQRIYVDGVEYQVEAKKKPKGDPNAVVDPRGEWSVVFELGGRTVQRTWTLAGSPGAYTGTAETRSGTVTFERVELAGNVLTVTFPATGGVGATEITVIVTGEAFEGVAEMESRSVPVQGTRTRGPEGTAP
jgi:imidazolonepropionase-like amidohydrolase